MLDVMRGKAIYAFGEGVKGMAMPKAPFHPHGRIVGRPCNAGQSMIFAGVDSYLEPRLDHRRGDAALVGKNVRHQAGDDRRVIYGPFRPVGSFDPDRQAPAMEAPR